MENMDENVKKYEELLAQAEKVKQSAIEELLSQKKTIDAKLAQYGYMGKATVIRKRAPKKCRVCGTEGHTARTCPQKQ